MRRYRVCASPAYRQSAASADMAELAWIAPDDFLPDHVSVAWRCQALPGGVPGYRCNSMWAVSEWVQAGLGVAVLPDFLLDDTTALQPSSDPLPGCGTAFWLLPGPTAGGYARWVALFDELSQRLREPQ